MIVPNMNRTRYIYDFLEESKAKGIIIEWSGSYVYEE